MLPPMFEWDDGDTCLRNEGRFCKVEAVLNMPNNNLTLLNKLQDILLDKTKMDRSVLRRAICVPKDVQDTKSYLTARINENLESFNLTAEIDYQYCTGENLPNFFDYAILYVQLFYIIFVLFATVYSINRKSEISNFGKFVCCFSLLRSWRKRTVISKSEDHVRLLSMQGIRTLVMLSIISTHICLLYGMSYIHNPEEFETLITNIRYFLSVAYFLVLPFFLMSSWLLSLQIYKIQEKCGEFTFKHAGIIIINRYFRFSTAYIIIAISSAVWTRSFYRNSLQFDISIVTQEMCREGWLYSLLHLSNFSYLMDICQPVTWYLSVDFQLYVLYVFVMYIVFKYKLPEFTSYGVFLGVCWILHAIVLYYYDVNLTMVTNCRSLDIRHFRHSSVFLIAYSSTVSNMSASFLGVIFGAIYFKYKNIRIVRITQISLYLWVILFFGLPLSAVFINLIEYNRLESSFIGSLIRPMFNLGMGIGILGMSYKLGGNIRKFLENKYAAFLSNISFCTYITHIAIVFIMNFKTTNFNYIHYILDTIFLIPPCLLFGLVMTLLVEEPLLTLQKKFLPQIDIRSKNKLEESNKKGN
ncbi:unnamed protein product [Phyllotreta striolata]|uniref:Acyltransferase 3 domain-containing protein n=1 Tax=Phyllotreta striolata TaxID=444603 RepID=A0A9N9TNU2_PHYSR|nr:unnamed protein product [Phyllotreta striolata]